MSDFFNAVTFQSTNYLVPSAGSTTCVKLTPILSVTPTLVDWRQFKLDNKNFQPQGVFIDNTLGASDVTITINPIGYNIVCKAGQSKEAQFPAPNGQTASLVGNGVANLIFVDYPVLPSGSLVTIDGTPTVNIGNTPLPVSVPISVSGAPYLVNLEPLAASAVQYTITGAAVSGTATPTANTNMRYLQITASEDASLAAAGIVTVTVTLNGTQVYQEGIYLPASAGSIIGKTDIARIPFESIAFNAGVAGALVTTISTALATGQIDVNAYFGS